MAITILEVEFDKDGNLVTPAQEQDIITALNAPGSTVTDVVVMSHGWNNDLNDARTLYRDFFHSVEQVDPAAADHIIAVGILWPSKKFADADLIPGGAASADEDPIADGVLLQRLEDMKPLFAEAAANGKLEQMKSLVPDLHNDQAKQNQFVSLLGQMLDQQTDATQLSPEEGTTSVSEYANTKGGSKLLASFGAPIVPKPKIGAGGGAELGGFAGNPALHRSAPGAAAGLGDFFTGIKAGALRLLNFATYYVMKNRAGKIGRDSVNPLLQRIQSAAPQSLNFHLVGHSFGGRLVTAVVDGPNHLRIQTLLLLQAAYSHNGLASNFEPGESGFFHNVFDQHKVTGPILITHSMHDSAVGTAYPLASRLNGDDAAALGDANDKFGGMGANGAQHIEVMNTNLLPANGSYDFVSSGKLVFNLNGDSIIQSHGDVARPETAAALLAAIKVGSRATAAGGI